MLSIIIPVQKIKKTINPRYFYKKVFGIKETIDSIRKTIDVEFELIIIINDSENVELIEYIKNETIVSKYAVISKNIGVSRSWNIGAHLAEGKYLCFCNDDVEFQYSSFKNLLSTFSHHDKVGQIGPQGTKWLRDKPGEYLVSNQIMEADAIAGYFFIVPTTVFHEVGGFDNFYTPAGCEEIDMSFAIRNKGYKCLIVPNTGIIHHGNHGISSRNAIIKYFDKEINTLELDKRNKAYFVKKWYRDE